MPIGLNIVLSGAILMKWEGRCRRHRTTLWTLAHVEWVPRVLLRLSCLLSKHFPSLSHLPGSRYLNARVSFVPCY